MGKMIEEKRMGKFVEMTHTRPGGSSLKNRFVGAMGNFMDAGERVMPRKHIKPSYNFSSNQPKSRSKSGSRRRQAGPARTRYNQAADFDFSLNW